MLFNLNGFLMSVSFALDFVEMDILGTPTNHGKRTAYIAIRIAKEMGFNQEELHDIAALAMLHDNGLSEYSLHKQFLSGELINTSALERVKEHCIIGEKNIENYPLLTNVQNIIKYHHESYDGTGFFGLKGEEIPLMSQIITAADALEKNFDLQYNDTVMHNTFFEFIKNQENILISPNLSAVISRVATQTDFWKNLKKSSDINIFDKEIPQYEFDLSLEKIREITNVLSKIIDAKSKFTMRHSQGLAEKAAVMADHYGYDQQEKMKLIIAADLHDLGKLTVPNEILDSPNALTDEEFKIIKKHTYYTRIALQEIKGFEEITEWASNHHEKLDGSGYPFQKTKDELDFNSRLMACLDIYEALTEERPYRCGLPHEQAIDIMNNMKELGLIDPIITNEIAHVFGSDNP